MYHELSRSAGQRSRLQRDIMYQHKKHYNSGTKIISEPSTTRNTMFKVIRSNVDSAITPVQIARLRSNLVQLHQVTGDTLQMFKVKGQRSRSQRNVKYQQQKRYNTTMDRFSDFNFGIAS